MSKRQALLPQETSLTLNSLSPELIVNILSYLPDTKWMFSMLLVCRYIYALTLPKLYEKLHFYDTGLIRYMVSAKVPGLDHLREIVISKWTSAHSDRRVDTPEDFSDRVPWSNIDHSGLVPREVVLHVTNLLKYISRNVLRKFTWNFQYLIPERILSTLWTRQRNLTSMGFWPTENLDKTFWKRSKPVTDTMSNLKKIYLHIDVLSMRPQAVKFALQNLRGIESLTLNFSQAPECRGHLRNSASYPLFGLAIPLETLPLFALRNLRLYRVDFEDTPVEITGAFQLSALRELVVSACKCPERFFQALTEAPNAATLQLEKLTVFHQNIFPSYLTENVPGGLVKLIDDFLASSRPGLRGLVLVLRGYQRLPKASGIMAHGSSLRTMILDVRTVVVAHNEADYAVLYRRREWRAICQSLSRLEQLAVTFPKVVTDGQITRNQHFTKYLIATAQILHLKLLNITTFPFPSPFTPLPRPLSVYRSYDLDHPVIRFAQAVMQAHDNSISAEARSHIQVLAFGIKHSFHTRILLIAQRRTMQAYFHRSASSTEPSTPTASPSTSQMLFTTLDDLINIRTHAIGVLEHDFRQEYDSPYEQSIPGQWHMHGSGDGGGGEHEGEDDSTDEDEDDGSDDDEGGVIL